MAETCVFCEREASAERPAWPDWLAAALREFPAATDEGVAGALEQELGKTTACVCDTCNDGWIRRLDAGVGEFLAPMIGGETTPLPPARRKILARWAAKTTVVMECAADAPVRTPRFAAQRLRTIGVHVGTQVLVGPNDNPTEVLGYRQDLFRRTVDGEERVASQSSLAIGKVLIQVFADPSRDTAPELVEDEAQPFIPLIGNPDRQLVWAGSPEVQIEDENEQGTIMANEGEAPRKMPPKRLAWAMAALGLVVALGALGYGLHERSSAARASDRLAPARDRVDELVARLGNEQHKLAASVSEVAVLKRSVATLAAGGAGGAPSYQPLSKIVAIVPAVTDGIRQCANAAVATAADARAYVAEYPRSKSDTVNADALTVTSACGDATKVAYTLDGYVNGP